MKSDATLVGLAPLPSAGALGPSDLRARLDAEAERQRRSRSFLVAEAVREYLDRRDRRGFGEARERTLREALALSPAERLRLSEELWGELAPPC